MMMMMIFFLMFVIVSIMFILTITYYHCTMITVILTQGLAIRGKVSFPVWKRNSSPQTMFGWAFLWKKWSMEYDRIFFLK